MAHLDWKKIATVGAIAGGTLGAGVGMVLSPGSIDTVLGWTDAAKGALTALLGFVTALAAALLARRKG